MDISLRRQTCFKRGNKDNKVPKTKKAGAKDQVRRAFESMQE